MKINFKEPRYILPLVILPFLCLFFYIYKTSFGKEEKTVKDGSNLQSDVAEVSDEVKKRSLQDKLEAYRNQYREADGYTAVGAIGEEKVEARSMPDLYNISEKRMLDSIELAMKRKSSQGAPVKAVTSDYPSPGRTSTGRSRVSSTDQDLAEALNRMRQPPPIVTTSSPPQTRSGDEPMRLFREQMKVIDSMGKANDPEYQAQQQRQKSFGTGQPTENLVTPLTARKHTLTGSGFNTVQSNPNDMLISAIVDQDITGYSGSRLRIRLLYDIYAGRYLVPKGTYIYAQISGFSGQRVGLSISTILVSGKLLPVRLEVYDNDGLPGLYVPSSAFRDFTKELGSGASQGITIQQQAENNSQLVMGMLQRMFQSTSSAVSKMLRSNKAKLKYNTFVYLVDPDHLKSLQQNYNK